MEVVTKNQATYILVNNLIPEGLPSGNKPKIK